MNADLLVSGSGDEPTPVDRATSREEVRTAVGSVLFNATRVELVRAPQVKCRPFVLDVDADWTLRALGVRLFTLAGIDPDLVALQPPPVVHRNHIECSEFVVDADGAKIPIGRGRATTALKKRRTVRNPMPHLTRRATR